MKVYGGDYRPFTVIKSEFLNVDSVNTRGVGQKIGSRRENTLPDEGTGIFHLKEAECRQILQ